MSVRGYHVGVDWSGHGTYANTLEDVTSYAEGKPDIKLVYGRDLDADAGSVVVGQLTFGLMNMVRQFSPENTASPIAGKVLPGRPARLQVTSGGTIHTLFDGVLEGIEVDPHAPAKTVTVTCFDQWGRRGSQRLSTGLYQGLRTGDAVNLILDAIGWTGLRSIDPGATVMDWWWEEDTDAAEAVTRLVDSEGPPALAYVEGGIFYFRDRHHRLTRAASITSQGLFTHLLPGSGVTGDVKLLRNTFVYDHGMKNIANTVSFAVPQRAPGVQVEVWSSDSPISLATGETTVIEAQASDPFFDAVTPVQDVDYIVDTGTVIVGLSRTSGQSVLITLECTVGPAVLSRLAVRATPVPVVRTVKVSAQDMSSINTFDWQTWSREVPFANAYDAQAIADRIVAVYATNRPTVTFTIGYTPSMRDASRYLQQILNRRISDRITVRNDVIGINADFVIERIEHEVVKLGAIHKVTFGCQVVEPTQPANVFTFNTAGRGFNDGAFGVTGIDSPTKVFRFDQAGQGFDQGGFGT